MDTATFYSRRKSDRRKVSTLIPPEESSESDISLSDDDPDYIAPSTSQHSEHLMDEDLSSDESIPG